eukprot:gnl/TRDRNA2_/TRDRNA2_177786_c0_seq14.p1 gnl/TRDRNA2_/TRDRNA2_177786_c0~~gnl/TRDRNA2_/TRDRNA2_177786_c0_seq14.p1  ORF type:complete len:564 (-),score=64.47 gnl/TRDRNA2_/TRDRNA2_177786_c0_seq14:259-1950(-)
MPAIVGILFVIFLLSTSALVIPDPGSRACDLDGERLNTSDFVHVDVSGMNGYLSLLQRNAQIIRSRVRETPSGSNNGNKEKNIEQGKQRLGDRRPEQTWDQVRLWPYGDKSKSFERRIGYRKYIEGQLFAFNREIFRPLWQKNLRCRGPSEESCEECVGADDCWSFVKHETSIKGQADRSNKHNGAWANRAALNAVQNQWVRHVNRIHVQCDSKIFVFQMVLAMAMNGKIRVRWDGIDVNRHMPEARLMFSFNRALHYLEDRKVWRKDVAEMDLPIVADEHGKVTGGSTSWREIGRKESSLSMIFVIPVNIAGGHDLEIEFEPASSPAKVEFSVIQLYMPTVYSNCEDVKVCLAGLAKAGVAGQKLRNTNTLQKECLSSSKEGHAILKKEGVFKACRQWRKCLKEHRVAIGVLLDAAGVGEFTDQSPEAAATAVSEAKCIYPPHEDPESWDCDCYKEMLLRCQNANTKNLPQGSYTEKICLRAHFCLSPRVCTGWKSAACADPLVVAMQGALPNDHTSAGNTVVMHNTELSLIVPSQTLMQRSSFAGVSSAKLDESALAKRCK